MIEKDYAQDLGKPLLIDCDRMENLHFELKPLEAYLLVSLVALAITHDEIPENPENFGKSFVKSFCDRYRDELPAMVESFELVNEENYLMTQEEFEELHDDGSDVLDRDWEKILDPDAHDREVESLIKEIHDIDDDFVDDFA